MSDTAFGREPLAHRDQPLPVGSIGRRASGWWGAWFLIISEASIFAYLFFSYFYYSIQPQAEWVPGRHEDFTYSAPETAVMLIGCATAWWAIRAARRNERLPLLLALALTMLLAAAFIALGLADWLDKPYTFSDSAYSAIYFTTTGLHLAHVAAGWIIFLMLLIWSALGYFDAFRHAPIAIGALYWYFLAAVWLGVFFVLYITPYLT
jgi:cytochrome c oxidase subunit 3